jgi:subtilisin family serine protease
LASRSKRPEIDFEQLLKRLKFEALEPRLPLSTSFGADDLAVAPAWFQTVDAAGNASSALAAFSEPQFPGPQYSPPDDIPGSGWIVRLTADSVRGLQSVAETVPLFAGTNMEVVRGLGSPGLLLVEAYGSDVTNTETLFRGNPHVASFQKDGIVSGQVTKPNDNHFITDQWGLDNIGQFGTTMDSDIDAPEAWDITTGSPNVVIGVLDSGVDPTHPDLYKNIWLNQGEIPQFIKDDFQTIDVDDDGLITFWDLNDSANVGRVTNLADKNSFIDAHDVLADPRWANGLDTDRNGFVDDFFGWNFLRGPNEHDPNNPMDDLGHGTHVSGILGAMGNNGEGVAGVNWQTSIMALKFLDQDNQGTIANAILAVNYATMMRSQPFDVNIRVTNNSWGQTGGFNEELRQAIAASGEADILFVAAAGNGNVLGQGINNDVSPFYPASYELDNVIAVAASTPDDRLARFSNYGPKSVDIAAPGVGIYSTVPGGEYRSFQGTSMATPHVAGAAALVWSEVTDASVSEVRTALLDGADDVPALGGSVSDGRLNVDKAVRSDKFLPRAHLEPVAKVTSASRSASRTYSIQNTGADTVNLIGPTPVRITGPHASDFSVISQPGQLTLASGQSVNSQIRFTPSQIGLRQATVEFATVEQGVFQFAIRGLGLSGGAMVSSADVDGGVSPNVPTSAEISALDLGEQPSTLAIAPFIEADSSVEFAPDALELNQPSVPPIDDTLASSGVSSSAVGTGAGLTAAETFNLHSRPGSNYTIFLDFDGHATTSTRYNSETTLPVIQSPPFDIDGDPNSFSGSELDRIEQVWQRVAEDFIPFDVDVTTQDPGVERLRNAHGLDTQWGVRIVVTKNTFRSGNIGGDGFVGNFASPIDEPQFVFNSDEDGTAEVASFMSGRSLGLANDASTNVDFYQGHGSGNTSWGPIMGAAYGRNLTTWDNGTFFGAVNTGPTGNIGKGADDLATITSSNTGNGFGYRPDDHRNTFAMASPLNISNLVNVSAFGIIEQNTDIDIFSFQTSGGPVSLNISPLANHPNLDIWAGLYSTQGELVAQSNPTDSLSASFSTLPLGAGTYYLRVEGVGSHGLYNSVANSVVDPSLGPWEVANPVGYSDYGSLGQYSILGTIPQTGLGRFNIVASDAAKPEGQIGSTNFTFTVTRSGNTNSSASVMYAVREARIAAPGDSFPFTVNGNDFVGGSLPTGTLDFLAGETSKTIQVGVTNDFAEERDEQFEVILSNPSVGWLLQKNVASGTLLNDDDAGMIGLRGNSLDILNGDSTPSTADGTDFGSTSLFGGLISHTFTIENRGTGTLELGSQSGQTPVFFQNGSGNDFAVSVQPARLSLLPGEMTTFEIEFRPSASGARAATFLITSKAGNSFAFAIQGFGTEARIEVFGNGIPIFHGDVTPSNIDGTYFGSASISGSNVDDVNLITVIYSHDAGINLASIDRLDLLIDRQWGPRDQLTPAAVNASMESNGRVRAEYLFSPPGGSWDVLDFGEYQVVMQPGEVVNGNGFSVPAQILGSFEVRIADPTVFYVNTIEYTDDDDLTDGVAADVNRNTSLRAAIMQANFDDVHRTIILPAGTYAGGYTITGDVAIYGDNSATTVIEAPPEMPGPDEVSRHFSILDSGTTLVLQRIKMQGGPGKEGGILVRDSALTIRESIITGITINLANFGGFPVGIEGGGIHASGSTVLIVDSTLSDNENIGDRGTSTFHYSKGGAVFVGPGSTVNVQGSTISGNRALSGGGILVQNGVLSVSNSTISGNSSDRYGGAAVGTALGFGGTVTLTNVTITGNTATSHLPAWQSIVQGQLSNSIVAGNNGHSQVTSLGHNLFDTAVGLPSDLVDPEAANFLGPLQDNGGPTFTHALLRGSSAIDSAGVIPALTQDQRGVSRLRDEDGDGMADPDIGAYEAFYVSIEGVLFEDQNADGIRQLAEPGLAGRTLYVDANGSGTLDPGEPSVLTNNDDADTVLTDETGQYRISKLLPGNHRVTQLLHANWRPTSAGHVATSRVSVNSNGSAGVEDSSTPSISDDGRFVAFYSESFGGGVFVYDRQIRKLEPIAVGGGSSPAISGNGQFVAYTQNGQIYVFDRSTKIAQLIGSGSNPSFSDDARYVAHETLGFDHPFLGNGGVLVVFDREAMNYVRFEELNFWYGRFFDVSISGNGQYVIATRFFQTSTAATVFDLVNFDQMMLPLYIYQFPWSPDSQFTDVGISDDGRFAVALDRFPNPQGTEIWVADVEQGIAFSLSAKVAGSVGQTTLNGSVTSPAISGDGQIVAFSSTATNIVPGTPPGTNNVFIYDMQRDKVELVSVSDNGIAGIGSSTGAQLDYDGSSVAFASVASNLIVGDTNAQDIFVRDRAGTDRMSVTLSTSPGDIIRNVIFGTVALPGEIRGKHFHDLIPNGVKDAGELGLAGWTVYLDTNNNGQLNVGEPSTVTDVDGNYSFTNLPANRSYKVAMVLQSGRDIVLPVPDPENNNRSVWQVFVGAGAVVTDRDFGSRPTTGAGQSEDASVQGIVFQDINGDGVHQVATEPGVANRVVFLDGNEDGVRQFDEPQSVTDETGRYIIPDLGTRQGAVRLRDAATGIQTTPIGNSFAPRMFDVDNDSFQFDDLRDLVVGDFNGDGFADVAGTLATSTLSTGSSVALLLNDHNGGYADAKFVDLPSALGAGALVAGHFNNNNQLDLAVASLTNSKLSILLDFNGTSFTLRDPITAGLAPSSIAAADFDKDGDTDLVLANEFNNTLSIMANNGSGTFTQIATPSSGGNKPATVVVGQFNDDNGDGQVSNLDHWDLAVANFGTRPSGSDFGNVAVLLGSGTGNFGMAKTYRQSDGIGVSPINLTVGDFNGDGKTNLAVTNFESNSVSLLMGSLNGTFTKGDLLSAGNGPVDISAVDIEGDGDLDLIVSGVTQQAGNLAVLRNRLRQGFAEFEPLEVVPLLNFGRVGLTAFAHAPGDVNKDGLADIVVADGSQHKILQLTNSKVNGAYRVAVTGTEMLTGRDFGLRAATLAGDHNLNGTVDAADYVLWRKNNLNGQQGYNDWRANFGRGNVGIGADIEIAGGIANSVVQEQEHTISSSTIAPKVSHGRATTLNVPATSSPNSLGGGSGPAHRSIEARTEHRLVTPRIVDLLLWASVPSHPVGSMWKESIRDNDQHGNICITGCDHSVVDEIFEEFDDLIECW